MSATRATDISPRNKALILSSILRNGAPRCVSLSASSSSSIGGASSRRGVERPSAAAEAGCWAVTPTPDTPRIRSAVPLLSEQETTEVPFPMAPPAPRLMLLLLLLLLALMFAPPAPPPPPPPLLLPSRACSASKVELYVLNSV